MKEKKRRMADFFATAELPISEREKIEIFRNGSERRVLLNGVRRILLYGESEMRFALRQGGVSVLGRGLSCTAYEAGRVAVDGCVLAVSFGTEGRNE